MSAAAKTCRYVLCAMAHCNVDCCNCHFQCYSATMPFESIDFWRFDESLDVPPTVIKRATIGRAFITWLWPGCTMQHGAEMFTVGATNHDTIWRSTEQTLRHEFAWYTVRCRACTIKRSMQQALDTLTLRTVCILK